MIDTTFDFRSDTPAGKDPDTYSRTLGRYHQLLWSKPLPGGAPFGLDVSIPPVYLHHLSELGEFWLASDAVIPTFRWMPRIVEHISDDERDAFIRIGYTIGGMMVFPANRVDGKMTINGARGWHPKIKDCFDLTVECIRRHYLDEPSPLGATLARYADFFGLFGDFAGYVEFFLLQDIVKEAMSAVKFFMPFENFAGSPLPRTVDAYLGYRERAIEFIESRNRRIAAFTPVRLPMDRPTAAPEDEKLKAVLALAQKNEDGAIFEDFLTVSKRLGLHARPYVASLMFTPPTKKTRMLFTLWTQPGASSICTSSEAFEEFFPGISADQARRQFGPDGRRRLDDRSAAEFLRSLERLFADIEVDSRS